MARSPRKPRVRGQCKDCEPGVKRMVRRPGPRCQEHELARKRALAESRHATHVEGTYSITADEYRALLEAQGGRCALCRRATGATRRLSVDHDHKTGEVRGLLCRPCNDILGHFRDSVTAFVRCVRYLLSPPARKVLTPRDWTPNLVVQRERRPGRRG